MVPSNSARFKQTVETVIVTANKPWSGLPPAARSFRWIWIAYATALLAALIALWQPWIAIGESVLVRALVADVLATVVIFAFSIAFANASFYDAYWSVAPPFLAGYFLLVQDATLDVRTLLVLSLVFAWAVRLTHNWARGWQGLQHEDWRYIDLRAKTGKAWWLVNLLGIHLFPTFLVFLGCIALQVTLQPGTQALGLLDALACAVGWSALWLEYTADNQLREFRTQQHNQGRVLDTGVWAWCRHPNYLGEIGFWFALFLYAWAAQGSTVFSLSFGAIWGPVVMLTLFVGITIPMIDKRLAAREGFTQHLRNTYALLPISHLRAGARRKTTQ